ncbi:unnamed protein product, partial [Phaeothamnion confervicola]
PCPAGTSSWRYGLRAAAECWPCAPGFFCPEASIEARKHPCGHAAVYCPGGTALPLPVMAGFYTVGGSNDGTTRTAQVRCERGYFCDGGIRYPCAPGRFGSSTGLTTPDCSGFCPAGFACPGAT